MELKAGRNLCRYKLYQQVFILSEKLFRPSHLLASQDDSGYFSKKSVNT